MTSEVTIKTDNPAHSKTVTMDELGYSVDEWHALDDDEKLTAVINYVGLDFDDSE